jgi:uncharacterized protein involved in exopolysaccharide biosynthesis
MNIDLNTIFNSIKNKKTLFLKGIIFSFIISCFIFFIIPKKYSSSINLLPEKVQQTTGFGAAIGMLGIDSGSFNQNSEQLIMPDIVEELLKSISFEKKLLSQSIAIDNEGNEEIIINYFNKSSDFEYNIEHNSKDIVQGFTNINKDIETGIYSIEITSDNPYVSYHLCNELYSSLTEHRAQILGSFNTEKKNFLNTKIKTVGLELDNTEKDLLDFVSKNSNYANSPSLNLVYQNKSRNVDLLSNLFWKYKQDLEILELENISMIGGLVIVDRPYIDLDPTFPSLKIILTIFLLINVFINIPFVLYVDRFKKG